MKATLSILIPTLRSRRKYLARLMEKFDRQHTDRIIIKTFEDYGIESGGLTVGAKRQRMLMEADTPYVCSFDDDDDPSEDYSASILAAIDQGADVVGFRLRHFIDGGLTGLSVISLKAERWGNLKDDAGMFHYSRTPNHLSPIRREIALEIGFKSLTVGEDADYSNRLFEKFGVTMKEVFVDQYLYDYLYRTKQTEPIVMYDDDDRLTRAGMEYVIRNGGSVSQDGRICTRIEQLV